VMTASPILQSGMSSLKKLEDDGCMTPEGRRWFIEATDPFHDVPIDLTGYPDIDVAGSVVQCIKQSIQINAPTNIPTADNWDCNIVMWPLDTALVPVEYLELNPGVLARSSTSPPTSLFVYDIGGVTALGVLSGQETYGSPNTSGANEPTDLSGLGLPGGYSQGVLRVIAKGFEVVDTTATNFQQGQVTVWRQPMPDIESKVVQQLSYSSGSTPIVGVASFTSYPMVQPPGTLANAKLLAGSQTWKSADGAYVIATMNGGDNPANYPLPVMPLVKTGEPSIGETTDTVLGSAFAVYTPAFDDAVDVIGITPVVISPFNMCGAYFTGLNKQSTIQLTVNYYVERYPSPSDQDLVVLASPSPGYDPCALELYSRTISKMPVGVPQGLNPLGEWFKEVLQAVTRFSTPILKVIKPALGPIGEGLYAGSKWVRGATAPGKKGAKAPPRKQTKRPTGKTGRDLVSLKGSVQNIKGKQRRIKAEDELSDLKARLRR